MKKTIAIFVNYNDGEDIVRSLKDLLSYDDISSVIVVDNGSSDNSLEIIKGYKKKNKNLHFIENGANLGFAKAANQGIKLAMQLGANYICVLNPDLVFTPGFMTKLIANGSDMVQMALKFKRDGKWVYDFGGKINWMLGRTYHLESDRPVNPHPHLLSDYVSGGATVIKTEVFKKIGLFDESYFMYFEDADLSIRAKNAGFTMAVEPNVIIEHKLEIHKKTKNWSKMKKNMAANWVFIKKRVPWYFKPTAIIYLILLLIKSWISVHI